MCINQALLDKWVPKLVKQMESTYSTRRGMSWTDKILALEKALQPQWMTVGSVHRIG
jgi:hypothetical protein